MRHLLKSRVHENFREVSTLVKLPPPLWGRVGERGKPRALTSEMRRCPVTEPRETLGEESLVFASHRAAEQATPLSLTLPRKGNYVLGKVNRADGKLLKILRSKALS
jgi:hypothetical protein